MVQRLQLGLWLPGLNEALQLEQRTASFTPADLSGLALWLKADAITGLADGEGVATWPDSSGNGWDATQATEANQPTYQTNEQNGLPGVNNDGVNDALLTASMAHGIGTGEFYTAFAVKTGDLTAGAWRAVWGNGASSPGLFLRSVGTNKFAAYFGSQRDFDTVLSEDTTYLLEFWRAAGVLTAAVNGVQEATTHAVATSVANAVQGVMCDGDGSTPMSGFLLEGIETVGFPVAQQASIRSYFNSKWAIY